MSAEIPLYPGVPYYDLRIRLTDVDYVLLLDWNGRENRFYLSLLDRENNPLVSGLKVLSGFPLLARRQFDPRLPPGTLWAQAEDRPTDPPTLQELGARVRLWYYEPGELP